MPRLKSCKKQRIVLVHAKKLQFLDRITYLASLWLIKH